MASSVDDPLILIHGESKSGKRSLLEGLASNLGGRETSTSTISFDTKYYTARAKVDLSGGSHPVCSADREMEAVLIVFDASRESTFESIKTWEATNENCRGAEIKLCIANRVDALCENGVVKRPEWMNAANDWCTDRMFEYIEVAPKNAGIDASLELEGERQGLRRVVSALKAHMWPGLTMKDTSGARSDGSGARDCHSTDALPVGGGADFTGPPQAHDQHDAASQIEIKETENGISNGHQGALGGSFREGGDSGDGLERESDRFDALMTDMLGARGRLQNLPDEQRRAAAESLTMQMMAQFGLDEDDSDFE